MKSKLELKDNKKAPTKKIVI